MFHIANLRIWMVGGIGAMERSSGAKARVFIGSDRQG